MTRKSTKYGVEKLKLIKTQYEHIHFIGLVLFIL